MSQLTLKCEKFGLSRGLHDLLSSGDLVDVTLACQGQFIQAHKTVLAACSPHFRSIFKMNPWQHPIVFMHDLKLTQLQALVDFMYNGEVTVEEEDLTCFLNLADALKVNGLTPQEKQDTGSWLPNYVQNDMQMTPSPSTPPPPAKIARRTHDRDVSRCDPLPVAPPAAPTNEESNSQQSWAPLTVSMTEEAMLTSDIKVEDEELRDIPAPEQNPISNSTQDCQPEEAEEEGADDSRVELDDNQEEEEGPSTSSQSKKPARQRRVSGVRSRELVRGTHGINLLDEPITIPENIATELLKMANEAVPSTLYTDEDVIDLTDEPFIDNTTLPSTDPISMPQNVAPTPISNTHSNNDAPYCNLCSTNFSTYEVLINHMKEFHNFTIWKCKFCPKEFFSQAEKTAHVKQEHAERRLPCRVCSRTFADTACRLRHEKQVHEVNGGRPLNVKCELCNKLFASINYLMSHNLKYHTDKNKK